MSETPLLAAPAVASGLNSWRRGWLEGWHLPEALALSEWADRYRILPRKGAAEPGRWRTDRTPYLREIMDCLSPESPVQRVVLQKGTQLGGTEVGNNWVGFVIDHAPGPMMVVQPTVEVAQRWSRQRIAAMIEEMPRLQRFVKPARARDSGNTTLLKEFRGGVLVIAGANSASGLRSMPVRHLFLDEVDAYPEDVGGEGHPVELAERRTSTFVGRKVLIVSSPTLKDCSTVEREYLASDQRHYHVPCPHCDGYQVLRDEQLQDDGRYLCEHCGTPIEHHHKTEMLEAGRWVPEAPGRPTRGYQISSLYAPIGLGYTWEEVAAKRAEAKDDPALRKTYVNTLLGETYEDTSGRIEPNELGDRAESWMMRTIPPGGLVLTAGVDVQINRFAVLLCAWGRGEECWVADWVELPADPTQPESWEELARYLERPIRNSYGIDLRISACAVDSGNWTHEVYQFTRSRQSRGIFAVKGLSVPGRPIITRPSRQDVNRQGRTVRHGVALWPVGVDTAKHTLMARLMADAAAEVDRRRIHFPQDAPEELYQQLAGEVLDVTSGRWVRIRGRRNEALDCWVYAYAAACHPLVRVHTMRDADWSHLSRRLEPVIGDMFGSSSVRTPEKQVSKVNSPTSGTPTGHPPAPASVAGNRSEERQRRRQTSTGFGSDDWAL